MKIDIFCKVIDNYGDIGFSWRLANDLANNYNCVVRLIVDNLTTFSSIRSEINPSSKYQVIDNITILDWNSDHVLKIKPAELIIETFSCNIPDAYMQKIIKNKSCWLTIEYLTAESWIEDYHLLPSKTSNNSDKFFFFPGFNNKTGGLILEPNLIKTRNVFQQSLSSQISFLKTLGLDNSLLEERSNKIFCYLFCYNTTPITDIIKGFKKLYKEIVILANLGNPILEFAKYYNNEMIKIIKIPFVNQNDFDKLLWSMDINFVRGEDSFIRAIWSGRPLVWNIYKQKDNIHINKLDCWIDIYNPPSSVKQLIYSWNQNNSNPLIKSVQESFSDQNWIKWQEHAKNWSDNQSQQSSLSYRLLKFCTKHFKKVKIL
ncbi:MAG: elongation factor P maturation arginine rhamnosyltransferase EarP [Candidatus Kinetoplastibacterium crithidii]|nr:MAG: elongation factor P maturation arginine rhamnosyltransferase EarP [Candidatus Kinetoplastibacterium crithidii]